MGEENITIGKRLSMLRQQNGLTQEVLADKLSISRQSVSKWETDGAVPDLEKLVMLSEIYQVSIDFLVKGEPVPGEKDADNPNSENMNRENTDTDNADAENTNVENANMNNTDTENADMNSGTNTGKPASSFMLIALLISGIFGLISLALAANIWFHFALFSNGKSQDIMTVTKIYEQYTKAEVQGVAADGSLYSKILWLDRQGVAEDDLLWAYAGASGHIRVPYYGKTVLIPLLCTALFWLLFLLCFQRLRNDRSDKKDIARMAGFSLIFVAVLLAVPVMLVLVQKTPEEKAGSRESGKIMQQETADSEAVITEEENEEEKEKKEEEEGQNSRPAEEDTFLLDAFGISLTIPLVKDFYMQGSYIGEDYHSVQLYGRDNGAWINCNLHQSNDFYGSALDYMMIQLENAKEWEEKWAGKEAELQTVDINGRVCYFYEIHYQYDGSDVQKVVGVCDVDDTHFLEVDCEGLDYGGVLNFEQIKDMFFFQ